MGMATAMSESTTATGSCVWAAAGNVLYSDTHVPGGNTIDPRVENYERRNRKAACKARPKSERAYLGMVRTVAPKAFRRPDTARRREVVRRGDMRTCRPSCVQAVF